MPRNDAGLEGALRDALAHHDTARLIDLYQAAAALRPESAAAFLTHAYVHALETGSEKAAPLKARLVSLGAET